VHDRGVDHERVRGGNEHTFGAAAALPFLDQDHQARLLQRAQVVVDALTAGAEFGRELGGRRRLAQPFEQLALDG
jgi:hypothetical protein